MIRFCEAGIFTEKKTEMLLKHHQWWNFQDGTCDVILFSLKSLGSNELSKKRCTSVGKHRTVTQVAVNLEGRLRY